MALLEMTLLLPSIIKTIFGITFLLELTLFLQSSRNNPFQDHIRNDHPSSIIKTIVKEPSDETLLLQ